MARTPLGWGAGGCIREWPPPPGSSPVPPAFWDGTTDRSPSSGSSDGDVPPGVTRSGCVTSGSLLTPLEHQFLSGEVGQRPSSGPAPPSPLCSLPHCLFRASPRLPSGWAWPAGGAGRRAGGGEKAAGAPHPPPGWPSCPLRQGLRPSTSTAPAQPVPVPAQAPPSLQHPGGS